MFKSPFSFSGRARRSEFVLSIIIYYIFIFLVSILGEIFEGSEIISLILYIPALWFTFAQGSKRCHDRGNSGWFQLIPFYIFWMLFADSEHGENRYGENPKGIGNGNEIDEIGNETVGE